MVQAFTACFHRASFTGLYPIHVNNTILTMFRLSQESKSYLINESLPFTCSLPHFPDLQRDKYAFVTMACVTYVALALGQPRPQAFPFLLPLPTSKGKALNEFIIVRLESRIFRRLSLCSWRQISTHLNNAPLRTASPK